MLRKQLLVLAFLLLPSAVLASEEISVEPNSSLISFSLPAANSAPKLDLTADTSAESEAAPVAESTPSQSDASAEKAVATEADPQPAPESASSSVDPDKEKASVEASPSPVADSAPSSPSVKPSLAQSEAPVANFKQPDLLSFGVGYVDFDKNEKRTQSADFRLEYRWGASLLSAHDDGFDFGIHPLAGLEVSTRAQIYGFGGLAFDLVFWKHLVFTESEAVGLFDSGNAKPLGSFIEFRSQAELGYRFDNDMRITGQISHISNAGLTNRNPGEEIAGAYIHIPVCSLFGR